MATRSETVSTPQKENILFEVKAWHMEGLAVLMIAIAIFSFRKGKQRAQIEEKRRYQESLSAIRENMSLLVGEVREGIQEVKKIKLEGQNHLWLPLRVGRRSVWMNKNYVLEVNVESEPRALAERYVGRPLFENEIVHHMNGNSEDNRLENLCLLDAKSHELFHSYIRWFKEKNLCYPSMEDQIRVLKESYGGVILSEALAENIKRYPARPLAKLVETN